ncbi:MAG: aminotransferase class I/II-fold pyridoxal phosphate-dependent enzyme [Clostridia bacterium]|nr:aminotransferase class I/II-fold pyridoxal phosphate-dependent enzyme [Clostridia bacterium]
MIFARENGRVIPREDKIFSISNRAKAMIKEVGKDKVINGTIGALVDDDGNLIVLDSVRKVFASLQPGEYAPYAPIRGIPEFREAVKKAAFGSYEPKGFTEVCATPGGTGGVRNTMANFSSPGEKVLVADWFWAPYKTISQELGRELRTFRFINEEGTFDIESFRANVNEILAGQDGLVVILNTPAHNPTGYSITVEEWQKIKAVFGELPADKKVTLLIDAAYIDFAGDEEEVRSFLPILDEMPDNVLPIMGYSASKTFTMYGMRCGAMICLAKTEEVADEFRRVTEVSSRASWSNCNLAPQTIIAKIFADPELKAKVDEERAVYRDMLLRRGRAFEEEAAKIGLGIVPFDAGFFVSIPMPNADAVAQELEKEGIFLVPLAKGLRVSVAAVSEEKARILPARIKACMDRLGQ